MNAPAALLEERLHRDARTSLEAFIRATKPDYEFGWFNALLCKTLEEFLADVLAGKCPRLMIFAPPRSGKTEIASRRFPAWAAGQHPWLKFIACSYGAALAEDMSGDCQEIVKDDDYQHIFPNIRMPLRGSGIRATNAMWNFCTRKGKKHGGYYRAAGVGGSITGKGFNIGIIDDPVKDYADAASPTKQDKNEKWYESTFYTRRDPKINGIIFIMTRWHKQDLGGKLLQEMKENPESDQWKIVRFPMVAEKPKAEEHERGDAEFQPAEDGIERYTVGGTTYKTRRPGDILFPERMPMEFVEKCRAKRGITWAALYQQRPTMEGGNFFKYKYWSWYDPWVVGEGETHENAQAMPRFQRMLITGDTAQKTGEEHDYSVFACWGVLQGRLYLIDLIRGKWEPHAMKQHVRRFWAKWGTYKQRGRGPDKKARGIFIEDKVSGTGLIQDLRTETFDSITGEPVEPIPCMEIGRGVGDGKANRAVDAEPFIASGLVVLPKWAPWLSDYLMEFEDFTLTDDHEHDDQVDVTLDAIEINSYAGGGMSFDAPWQ